MRTGCPITTVGHDRERCLSFRHSRRFPDNKHRGQALAGIQKERPFSTFPNIYAQNDRERALSTVRFRGGIAQAGRDTRECG